MKYREVTAEWIGKTWKKHFDSLDKEIPIGFRRRHATRLTIVSMNEFHNAITLDKFLKPQLEDFIKVLNYQGPIFQKVSNK